jgi:hypothetical protein
MQRPEERVTLEATISQFRRPEIAQARGTDHRFADHFGIGSVVLAAFHVLQRHQLVLAAQRRQLVCPVMGRYAGFDAAVSPSAAALPRPVPWHHEIEKQIWPDQTQQPTLIPSSFSSPNHRQKLPPRVGEASTISVPLTRIGPGFLLAHFVAAFQMNAGADKGFC